MLKKMNKNVFIFANPLSSENNNLDKSIVWGVLNKNGIRRLQE